MELKYISLQVLAHRLGLVPIFADPRYFSYPPQQQENESSGIYI